MTVNAQPRSIFDQRHYIELIKARGELIRRLVPELKSQSELSTALDAGCGLGFFAGILQECGLNVVGFDGREANVQEARERYTSIPFHKGDIEDASILGLGSFDLVLCFGLLYHLESPLLAIRHLHSLTRKTLLLESMCLPHNEPTLLLREEPVSDDQSLTDLAFYPSEGCIVKMLYRAGFTAVYRVAAFPDHDEFRDTTEYVRRRTVIVAAHGPVAIPGLIPLQEPHENRNPWWKTVVEKPSFINLVKQFLKAPFRRKYAGLGRRLLEWFPGIVVPVRLPFGIWWLARQDHVSKPILSGAFENSEYSFVRRFLQPGMTVLDIGAHHGFYTLLAAKRVGPTGTVIAFEPSARERRVLRIHSTLNRCRNVRILPLALGAENGSSDLYVVEKWAAGCNSLRPPAADIQANTTREQVRVARLDDQLALLKIDHVDFMKLDVEGGELAVLQGAEQLLARRPRPVILAEVQDVRTQPWGYRAQKIVDYLRERGYEWFHISPEGLLEELDVSRNMYDENFVACPKERAASIQRLKHASSTDPNLAAEKEKNSGS